MNKYSFRRIAMRALDTARRQFLFAEMNEKKNTISIRKLSAQ